MGFGKDESTGSPEPAKKNHRLDSWKEIVVYLERTVPTVSRWEKTEDLPVHRHMHTDRGTVYAYSSEIDQWLAGRRPELEENGLRPRAALFWQDKKTVGVIGLGAGLLLLTGALGWILPDLFSPDRSAAQLVTKFSISVPATQALVRGRSIDLAISPDGRRIVYVGYNGSTTQLYLRPLDEAVAEAIPDTEGAGTFPFFSPDGQSLGFFADGKLKRLSFNGGPQITLCYAGAGWVGGSWNSRDTIVFSAGPKYGDKALYRVSALGGERELVARPDSEKGERSFTCPKFLPGGKHLFFDAHVDNSTDVRVMSLATGEQKVVVEDGVNAYYAATGHLVYQRGKVLLAAPFDLARLELVGSPVPVLKGISGVDYALAADGTLAYVPSASGWLPQSSLVWVDREGTEQEVTEDKRSYLNARISPDGKQIAVVVSEDNRGDVWVYDLESDSFRRLTEGGEWNSHVLWTPDGQRIVFASKRDGEFHLYRKRTDGSTGVEHLITSQSFQAPASWSPDGDALALFGNPSGNYDISILLKEDGGTPRPFISSPENEWSPQFSPNGKWLAYVSIGTDGSNSVYVRPYPEPDVTWLVLGKQDFRMWPQLAWSPDGSELFHCDGEKMTAVSVQMEPNFKVSKPRVLFQGSYLPGFDISPDGQRFLMMTQETESTINVVLNWFEELERLVPVVDSG